MLQLINSVPHDIILNICGVLNVKLYQLKTHLHQELIPLSLRTASSRLLVKNFKIKIYIKK